MSTGRRQSGFTYVTAMVLVAATGAGLATIAELHSHARQREKEAELLWIGEQYRQAIALYYQRSPGAIKRYPAKLEDLLDDRRHFVTARYLRRLYADPMTGKAEWGLIRSPAGGIMGVHSLSQAPAIRQINSGRAYSDWHFVFVSTLPVAGEGVRNPRSDVSTRKR